MSTRNWFLTLLLSVAVAAATYAAFDRVLRTEIAAAAPAVQSVQSEAPTVVVQATAVEASTASAVGELPNEAGATVVAADDAGVAPTAVSAAPTSVAPVIATSVASGTVKVVISAVRQPGKRTSEFVLVVNEADNVDMTGWALEGSNGKKYTFPDFVLFRNTFVRINTMVGADGPMDLFWGQDEAVWKSGDVIVLKNGDVEMSRFTVK